MDIFDRKYDEAVLAGKDGLSVEEQIDLLDQQFGVVSSQKYKEQLTHDYNQREKLKNQLPPEQRDSDLVEKMLDFQSEKDRREDFIEHLEMKKDKL